jgi:hypothetical protein
MVNLIVFLEAKGYPFKVLLKRTRGLVLNGKIPVWNFCFWHFQNDFASGHVSGELPVSPFVRPLTNQVICVG